MILELTMYQWDSEGVKFTDTLFLMSDQISAYHVEKEPLLCTKLYTKCGTIFYVKNSVSSITDTLSPVSQYLTASKCAEVTEEVAIEFAEWCNPEDPRQGNVVYIRNGNFYWHKHKQYTIKELFQEFLKIKTG